MTAGLSSNLGFVNEEPLCPSTVITTRLPRITIIPAKFGIITDYYLRVRTGITFEMKGIVAVDTTRFRTNVPLVPL